MAKNKASKKQEEPEDYFDFSEMTDSSYDDETMMHVMHSMLEASHNQMTLALELTKLVLQRNVASTIQEEEVFSTFKKALKVVSESSPTKALWEKFKLHE